ncbi:hypothetical protein SAMN03080615_00310 [Amphritea atlantica]|uniref:Uncharacterized protein n=1 Tax=Amphritea atlantica TaxID=355243 RepID=A0A1H9D2I3_9GAMM|nr:hypothetical protein SAMN03080615_00310 [Amphritea atlantica]
MMHKNTVNLQAGINIYTYIFNINTLIGYIQFYMDSETSGDDAST